MMPKNTTLPVAIIIVMQTVEELSPMIAAIVLSAGTIEMLDPFISLHAKKKHPKNLRHT